MGYLIGCIEQAFHHLVNLAAQLLKFRRTVHRHPCIQISLGNPGQFIMDGGNTVHNITVNIIGDKGYHDKGYPGKIQGHQECTAVHLLVQGCFRHGNPQYDRLPPGKDPVAFLLVHRHPRHLIRNAQLLRPDTYVLYLLSHQ